MKTISFIRHAESAANRVGIWNGRSDGPLSEEGHAQLRALGARLADTRFDLVVSSPLERARRTAAVFSDEVEIDAEFIEIDLGRWDGWTSEEVQSQDGAALRAAVTDRTSPMGATGESLNEAGQRVLNAVDKLVALMPDDSTAAVVTHGGLLQTVLHQFLPGDTHRVHSFVDNTSITTVKVFDEYSRLASFNDTGHLGPRSSQVAEFLAAGQAVVSLIRHGQTKANVEQRWQGQGDWDLDETGYLQAEALGTYYGRWGSVFSSPLQRARNTAGFVSAAAPVVVDDLKEVNMGDWEGLTTTEIAARWPDVLERIYQKGIDLKRGTTGESWAELTARVRSALETIEPAIGEPTVVVAHGGAIRAYISSLTASNDTYAESLYTPPNTSISHVAFTDRGPLILDYGVATHLEGLQS
ncbi:MAG TPA: histidine phosphatase family protein [Acidimicrobiia bacterium]|nr:histidine phosphatase family protein [Acidimicrobiia bacterium]